MGDSDNKLLITGGRVIREDGDNHRPAVADILIEGNRIQRIEPGLAESAAGDVGAENVIDAHDKLVVPGFVNSHYHSHDVLLKGCFETIPLETWVLNALPPSYPKRSTEEVRARTLLGAAECLHTGMTTVQDMLTIFPFSEEHLDTVMQAYTDVGIRVVFAIQIGDVPGLDRVPFWRELIPEEYQKFMLVFAGTIWLSPDGNHQVPCATYRQGEWSLIFGILEGGLESRDVLVRAKAN